MLCMKYIAVVNSKSKDRFYGVDIRLMLIDSWWETQVAAHLKDLQEVRESWL